MPYVEKRNWKSRDPKIRNWESYDSWLKWLSLITRSMWEWKGFPKSVNTKFLERKLFYRGWCSVFEDSNIRQDIIPKHRRGNKFALCGRKGTLLDINSEPLDVDVISENGGGYTKHCIIGEDAVIINNNDDASPSYHLAKFYAERLSDLERTIDVNIGQQKTPSILYSDTLNRNTLKTMQMKIDDNELWIFGNKSKVNLGDVKQINTQAPFVADKLTALQHDKLVEYFMRCGFEAFESQKKERLVSDEAKGTEGISEGSRNIMEIARMEGAENYNLTWPDEATVSVRFRSELLSAINSPELVRLGMLGGGIDKLTESDISDIIRKGEL